MKISKYSNGNKSHDQTFMIDKHSLLDQCVTPSFDQFPIWEIFCRGPSCKSMNQSMNQSIKIVTISWNDKE